VAAAPAPAPVAAPAPAPAPAAPAAEAKPQTLIVQTTFGSDEEAKNALALLYNDDGGADLSKVFDDVKGQGGVSFSHPFAQIKQGNWDVYQKGCPDSVFEYMPAGNRPFTMVYLGHRVGATGWIGESGSGKPPVFKFAIPHRKVFADATELTRQVISIGRKVQFKILKEASYAHLGKLTPETHIFGWTPNTGFIILSVPGYSSTDLTTQQLATDEVKAVAGKAPLVFTIEVENVVNKNAQPGAKNAAWKNYYAGVAMKTTEQKSVEMYTAWNDFQARNQAEVARQTFAFLRTEDFKGLPIDQVTALLQKYAALG
jgi:hypothetical protein